MLPPDTPELYVAMSDTAIALSAGISDSSVLQKELEAPASERDLLLHGHMTGEFYQSMVKVMEQMPANDASEFDIEMLKQWRRLQEHGVLVQSG